MFEPPTIASLRLTGNSELQARLARDLSLGLQPEVKAGSFSSLPWRGCCGRVGMKGSITFRNSKALLSALFGTMALGFFGCSEGNHNEGAAGGTQSGAQRIAIAELSPTEGNDTRGTVTFIEDGDGIRVIANVTGLSEGKHGFHIHENGDCSAPDASSAGGHFNPTNHPHAGPDAEERHVGDLGNLEAIETGAAAMERVDTHLTFDGQNSIIGKAVVVHAGEDDLTSQPSGDSGNRIACGVIELQEQ